MLGLLVGDALGVPYEFHPSDQIPDYALIEFDPPTGFARSHAQVPPGTYSDDGAQALVLLDSLLACGRLDLDHFAQGLVRWHDGGHCAVDGIVFDVGIQTSIAIGRLKRGIPAEQAGGADEFSNGNGSLMRVLPLALWHSGPDTGLIRDAFAQSGPTHRHVRSQLCCALYCLWARRILQGVDNAWDAAVEAVRSEFRDDAMVRRELEGEILERIGAGGSVRGSGYVVESLNAALWANRHDSFEDVVKFAVMLGDDTDTTAAIAGGIAGLKWGGVSIPDRWRSRLRGREHFAPLLDSLLRKAR